MNAVPGFAGEPPRQLPNYDFMAKKWHALFISGVLIVICLLSFATQSLQLGLDFSSGQAIRLRFEQTVSPERVAEELQSKGYGDVRVSAFGSDREVRILLADATVTSEQIEQDLEMTLQINANVLGSDFVSARAGADMLEKSGFGVLVALGAVTAYISLRFQFKFALAALAALAHDVILTVGFFSVFGLSFDFSVLAAIMAVIGYSLNDTIIVADRIRENFRRLRNHSPEALINLSVNQTLSRTIITSSTTLIVVLVLLFLGGPAIRGFATAMTIGIVVGTYSSIFIASSLLLMLRVRTQDLIPAAVEEDNRP
jgi:preprotein translocase subunit SecF